MRQKDNASFAELLNRIREGKHTDKDMRVLKTRAVTSEDASYQTLKNELHLFPCNAAANAHNTNIYNGTTTEKVKVEFVDAVLEDSSEVKSMLLTQLKGKNE